MDYFPFVHGSYYPSWKVYKGQTPSTLDLTATTHVFYAFLRLLPNGDIQHLDEKADLEYPTDGTKGCLNALSLLKRERFPHLKLIVSLGGGSGSGPFAELAAVPESRARLAQSVRKFVDQYGFDGVDVDWEHPSTPEQGQNYVILLGDLRKSLPAPRYLLTTALPVGEWSLRHINLKTVGQLVDLVNLMCYDFAGPWTKMSGHQSQLYSPTRPHNDFAKRSVHGAVTYFLSHGVHPRKIVLGIPLYGRQFPGLDRVGQSFHRYAGDGGILDYKDLPPPGAQEFVDQKLSAAYCVSKDAGFITYDNPTTVAAKAQYVKAHKLGGLFYWTGTADAPPGPRSLITTGSRELFS
ncbi:CAZyme family GH18 [Paecilomyces variotii]|nr:CAZyme family GH18 [Paecilomyces variotii]